MNVKLDQKRTEDYAEMMQVRAENLKLREQLALVNCELAAKTATINALETQQAKTETMQATWTQMCTNMLGTIEGMKK